MEDESSKISSSEAVRQFDLHRFRAMWAMSMAKFQIFLVDELEIRRFKDDIEILSVALKETKEFKKLHLDEIQSLSVALKEMILQSSELTSKFFFLFCKAVISESISFPSLHTIDLRNVREDKTVKELARLVASGNLPALTKLKFRDCDGGVEGAKALVRVIQGGHLQSLEMLELSLCCIGNDGARALLEALPSTPILSVCQVGREGSSTPILSVCQVGRERSKAFVTAIQGAHLQSLHTIDLRNVREDKTVKELARLVASGNLPALTKLKFRDCDGGVEGAKALVRVIQGGHLQSLEMLELSLCCIGNDGARALLEALPSTPILSVCQVGREGSSTPILSVCQVGREGSKAFVTAIHGAHLQSLEMLSLTSCPVGDDGVRALVEALRAGQLPALTTLTLGNDKIGREGAKALATSIQSGYLQSLEKLSLFGCLIEDEGLRALAKACESGGLKSLVLLSLNSTRVGDESLVELAKVLRRRCLPNLRYLHLEEIYFSKNSVRAFKDAFAFNQDLVVDIEVNGPSLNGVKKLRERNIKLASMFKRLRGEREVPASHGKVFLCGDERNGKTTLRKTLQKKLLPILSRFKRERTRRTEPPTRGIQVSVIMDKGTHDEVPLTIAIWDLAGQQEYYTLHSAFLPDLAFADGKATTFVIVCDAQYTTRSSSRLNYWMRFIASSSRRGEEDSKRHVFVVLNRFDNMSLTTTEEEAWKLDVKTFRDEFHDYLDIHAHPFIVDARVGMEVRDLKTHLLGQMAQRLKDKRMPEICQSLANEVRADATSRTDFPVVTFGAFLDLHRYRYSSASDDKLQAALEYLHECGHLIYFREGSLSEGADPQRSLVVLDPDYFCQKVVGYLLLPERILEDYDNPVRRRMGEDGSILLRDMIRHLPLTMAQVEDLVAILVRLGLCYKVGNEKVLIPALVEKVDVPDDWRASQMRADDLWVMGFCLKVLRGESMVLPISVFRRLQVDLAQDDMCSNFQDSCYAVGKFHIAFRYNGMTVFMEFSDLEDRVDFLVKPLVDDMDAKDRRDRQVDLAHTLLVKFISLAETWCPGVEFDRLVVKPWFAGEGTLPMLKRDINMSVEEVKRRVLSRGVSEKLNWPMGEHDRVTAIELLSGEDLGELEKKRTALLEEVSEKLGLTQNVDGPFDEHRESSQPSAGHMDQEDVDNVRNVLDAHTKSQTGETSFEDMRTELTKEIWAAKNSLESSLKRHVDKGLQDFRTDFKIAQVQQKKILHKIHALRVFSIEEKVMSVPRFVYLTKSNDNSKTWVRLRLPDLFQEKFMLHFLCEANHSLHEIKGQEGIQIRNLKEWAEKLAPWVNLSLRAAFVMGNIAGQAVLPGLSQLISTFPSGGAASIRITVGHLCSEAGMVGGETSFGLKNSLGLKGSNALRPLESKDSLRNILQGLIGELPPGEFHRKFNLKRVALKKSGNVMWICDDCFNAYYKSDSVDEL